ncbi:MAG: DUF3291 domain-containing protein [Hyphomonadaceae bacterium]|nr:DUF3291 domain-containing protein [Hyphomonadaceae bacterium]
MHLAQINIGRLLYPQDDPRVAAFMDNLDAVNAVAERSPGFVWRFKDESGHATDVKLFDDPQIIVNASVWESAETLEQFVFKTVHQKFYAKRRTWFDAAFGPPLALWWIEEGATPDIHDFAARWRTLKEGGPTERAFGWEGVASAELWKAARCG